MINRTLRCLLLVSFLGGLAGCGSAPRTGGAPPPDRNSILLEEIQASPAGNAYLLIESLRPQWLSVRRQSISRPLVRRVYLDESYLGGLSALRQISRSSIGAIHFYDGPQATQKWGEDHLAGVIQIRTIR